MEVTRKMNRRRELALQRLSRIGSLAAVESAPAKAQFRGKPAGTLTIEAAIGTYMIRGDDLYDMRLPQDTYFQTSKDPRYWEQEQLSKQMTDYLSVAKQGKSSHTKTSLANDRPFDSPLEDEALQEILDKDPSARYQLSQYQNRHREDVETAYDRLDANRCSGFLLYSYNKHGLHSVLGEHITPGSYGGRITVGDFISDA